MVTSSLFTRTLIAGLVAGSLAACSSKDVDRAPPSAPEPAPAEPTPVEPAPEPAAADHASWDAYWPAFKAAALARDKAALRTLTHLGDELDEAGLDQVVEVFLSPEVLEVIGKADASTAKITEGSAAAGDDVRELMWSESGVEDGVETESALIFYFKKFDGNYRLFRVLAAG